ncbi:SLF2 protein, partial [Atractosteus spatula]|nr:SLF2 protein [Atractosteus spatula]
MKPSSLSRSIAAEKRREAVGEGDQVEAESSAGIDQQYYLCSSLLALTNEVSNYDSIPPEQRDQLRILSAELDKHIKCDIRESDKLLYRSKVKDFVARIYTRWQVLLQKSRPQQVLTSDYSILGFQCSVQLLKCLVSTYILCSEKCCGRQLPAYCHIKISSHIIQGIRFFRKGPCVFFCSNNLLAISCIFL